jgi:HK97 gp10 family phage protein
VAKAGAGVIITGDKALDRLLKGLPLKVQKKLSRQATRKAAKEIVLPDAKARVPVDTGDLDESLTVKAVKRSRTKFGHEVRTKDGFYSGDQFYGGFVEFGTKERQHKSGKSVGSVKPHSFGFLRPAVYENESRIRDLYVTAMNALIAELPKIK